MLGGGVRERIGLHRFASDALRVFDALLHGKDCVDRTWRGGKKRQGVGRGAFVQANAGER
jgi:hypothetical protein